MPYIIPILYILTHYHPLVCDSIYNAGRFACSHHVSPFWKCTLLISGRWGVCYWFQWGGDVQNVHSRCFYRQWITSAAPATLAPGGFFNALVFCGMSAYHLLSLLHLLIHFICNEIQPIRCQATTLSTKISGKRGMPSLRVWFLKMQLQSFSWISLPVAVILLSVMFWVLSQLNSKYFISAFETKKAIHCSEQ